MGLGTELHQRLEQRMQLTQQLIQSLELLQLPILELRDMVTQELAENPTLEQTDEIEEKDTQQVEYTGGVKDSSNGDIAGKLDILEDYENLKDEPINNYSYSSDGESDKKSEMLQNIEAKRETLQEHLQSQLTLIELADDHRKIGEFIISNINDDGYLTV